MDNTDYLRDNRAVMNNGTDGNKIMSESNRYPSYAACVAKALSGSRRPLDVNELVTEVAASRPVGKAARSAVYRALDKLFQAVPVGSGRYAWLSHLLAGTVYCHPLTSEEIRKGHLLLDELEHSVFFPQFFQHYRPDDRILTVTLFGGPTVQATAAIEHKTWSLRLGQEFVEWLDQLGAENRDDLLIRVEDAFRGKYELRTRLREMRDERAIEQRNTRLALLAEEIVGEEAGMRDVMPTWDLVARLIGRDFFREMPPTDDLHYVLHEYSVLEFADGLGYQLDTNAVSRASRQRRATSDKIRGLNSALHNWQYRGYDIPEGDSTYSERTDEGQNDLWTSRGLDDQPEPEDEHCPAYQQYLESHSSDLTTEPPLSHDEFHLLEAELDLLLQLEIEFGVLLPEQQQRKENLADRLYIDPDSLASLGWDSPDDPNLEDPPFWSN